MKRAPWLVVAGAAAGFLGVVGLHKTAAPAALASQGTRPAAPASHSAQRGPARQAGRRPSPRPAARRPRRPPWAPWSDTATASWPPG